MNFSEALIALKDGKKVRHAAWGGAISLIIKEGVVYYLLDTHLEIKLIDIDNEDHAFTSEDLLSEDWEIVE